MPVRSFRPCSYPGCHELVSNGSRCALHAQVSDRARGTSTQRGYGYHWRKIRDNFLAKNPWCIDPFGDHPSQRVAAHQVDHVIPRSNGGTNDESNLQSLCDHCHDKKTASRDGGFGNRKPGRGHQISTEFQKVNRALVEREKNSPIETD